MCQSFYRFISDSQVESLIGPFIHSIHDMTRIHEANKSQSRNTLLIGTELYLISHAYSITDDRMLLVIKYINILTFKLP